MASRSRKGVSANSPIGMTIRDQLDNLRRIAPKRSGSAKCPHLYANEKQRDAPANEATLYVYIRSTDRTYALHESVFHKSRPYTALEWAHFFGNRVLVGWKANGSPAERDGILRGSIMPGVNLRTQGKQWSVVAVVGYVTHVVHESPNTSMAKRRNKTKSSRRKNGQNNLRRRHRNRSRKAK